MRAGGGDHCGLVGILTGIGTVWREGHELRVRDRRVEHDQRCGHAEPSPEKLQIREPPRPRAGSLELRGVVRLLGGFRWTRDRAHSTLPPAALGVLGLERIQPSAHRQPQDHGTGDLAHRANVGLSDGRDECIGTLKIALV